jgi:Tricorn protease C1 domain
MKKILLLFIVSLLFACSKLLIEPNTDDTPINNFNQLATDLKDKYVFFDYKKVNWDSVVAVHSVKINDKTTDEQLFSVFSTMLATLKDGHTSLYTPADTFRYYYYNGTETNYNKKGVMENYLTPNGFKTTETINHCLLANNIAYLSYASFKDDLSQKGVDDILNN